jgi:RNA polymerase sigma-70 factor (ECF subfamily)
LDIQPTIIELEAQFDALHTAIYKYFYLRGFDPEAAADLTATVFESSLQTRHGYDPRKASLKTWLFTIAHNLAINQWKSRQNQGQVSIDEAGELRARDALPEDRLVHGDEQRELLQALQTLDERAREVVSLKFSARLNNREIAALVGISASNVGVILYRALKQVRVSLMKGQSEENHE